LILYFKNGEVVYETDIFGTILYIVFEGIDLVGKSSQIELLQKEFSDFIFTKEPGGTAFGVKIREMILHDNLSIDRVSEFFLFLSDRSEHYHKVVKPNLQSGKTVVSDRSIISGMAYALQNGGISEENILNINLMTIENRVPDLVIFLEISKEELIKRRITRGHDNIEIRGLEYALQVQEYLEYWTSKLNIRTLKIDASKSIETIFDEVKKTLI